MSETAPLVGTEDVTKRLSFGEMSQQLNARLQVDAGEVARVIAEGHGDPQGFVKALEVLAGQCAERKEVVQGSAKEQSVSVGEADLRRMKRQFSSLKNTFLHYEVKDEFIAALADGLPNGTEDIQLQQFEEEAERTISLLRDWKAKNVAKQEEIHEVIADVDRLMLEVSTDSAKAMAELKSVFEEMAEFEAHERDLVLDIEPGMDEEACQRVIEEESKRATELEARLIAGMDELRSLESKLPSSRHELDMMRDELRSLEEALHVAETEKVSIEQELKKNTERTMKSLAEDGRKVAQQRARAKASAWAAESVLMLQSISGVSDVILDGEVLKLTNNVVYPVKTVTKSASEALMVANTASVVYCIELQMDGDTGHVVGGRVVPQVAGNEEFVGEVVEGVKRANRSATVERVLVELRTMLSAYHHRMAVIDNDVRTCGVIGVIDSIAKDARSFACEIFQSEGSDRNESTRVNVKMTGCWPEEDDRFEVEGDVGALGEKGLDELRALGFQV